MRRGEVLTLCDPRNQSVRIRVVVVSSDDHNGRPGARPHVVPIVRQAGGRPDEYVARLGEMDPISGVAVVNRIERVDPSHRTEQVGMLTGASMEAIGAAMRDFYELN